ncbi:MAG TPA: HisS family protein, partial [Isosphaeraceae bacterium]
MSIDPRVASGLRDVPPAVMIPRERMLETFRKTFASFGFAPIETPHIERMEVLTGKGAGSDEVLRQIFEVTNKGGTRGELALRFDLTVPLARFVAKHVNELGTPFKRYAIGSVFRGERPAKGRFREFVQCDFDTVGTESAIADAETAQVIYAALSSAGVAAFTIAINNRKVLDGFLHWIGVADQSARVLRAIDKLAKVGRETVVAELQGRTREDESGAPVGPALTEDQALRILDFIEKGQRAY